MASVQRLRIRSECCGNPNQGVAPGTPNGIHKPLQFLQVSSPTNTTMAESNTRFGFVAFAETWNGRLAMMGFVIGLATELLTGQGILGQLGLG